MNSQPVAWERWLYYALLTCAGLLVPRSLRKEWMAEWRSELWHLIRNATSRVSPSGHPDALLFCCGSFSDALWLRRNRSGCQRSDGRWSLSPALCIGALSLLAVISCGMALLKSRVHLPDHPRQFAIGYLLVFLTSLLLLRILTPFTLGEYPPTSISADRIQRVLWWLFFLSKCLLVVMIVSCGTLDLGLIIAPAGLRPHANIIGYVLGLRWAIGDQRRRCPVCLRVLINPVRIGEPSHIMLDWYGTELICAKGHGVLHVSQTATSSYGTQSWVYYDSSWRELFSH
jgi:hypothetical protein